MSQAQIKPEIFVNFMPEPEPKSPARLTTLTCFKTAFLVDQVIIVLQNVLQK